MEAHLMKFFLYEWRKIGAEAYLVVPYQMMMTMMKKKVMLMNTTILSPVIKTTWL
jgi:hypothetical protein